MNELLRMQEALERAIEKGGKTSMEERVRLGRMRSGAFSVATQRKGQPLTYGTGKPPEKS